MIKRIARSAYDVVTSPRLRYSLYTAPLRNIYHPTPAEEVLEKIMIFLSDGKIKGDYLEFGVWKGTTFVPAYHLAQREKHTAMRFWAFDSFEGLPALRGIDRDYAYDEGHFACSEKEFKNILKRKRVDVGKVTTVKGWFSKSLTPAVRKRIRRKAAVIWIDCDLYESTVPVMKFITDLVQDGTIIVFDDWFCFKGDPKKGEQRAFYEWLKRHPKIVATEFQKFGWGGNSFILHRKNGKNTL